MPLRTAGASSRKHAAEPLREGWESGCLHNAVSVRQRPAEELARTVAIQLSDIVSHLLNHGLVRRTVCVEPRFLWSA